MPISPRTTTADIPAIHAAIASPNALHRQRRALYQFAAELLRPDRAQPDRAQSADPDALNPGTLDPDVLDSPVARHHLGEALAGRVVLTTAELAPLSALSRPEATAAGIGVASAPAANTLLTGALTTVWAELGRQRAAGGPARLLTEDDELFASALAVLRDGAALARSVSPELADDLFGHIALAGIVDPQRSGRLASASPRNFPGLVLLETPTSMAAAEALLHEGAHQALFTLAITHDLLGVAADRCPAFHPPWRPERRWPLEQTLAACHAYCCLARFEQDLATSGLTEGVGADSLLPFARARSEILGHWLTDHGDYLGADTHQLLAGLLGHSPPEPPAAESSSGAQPADYVVDTELEVRHCGAADRVLVGRRSRPPELFWVSADAAAFLELARHQPLDHVAGLLAQQWQLPHSDTNARLVALLADLRTTGLVTLKGESEVTQRC